MVSSMARSQRRVILFGTANLQNSILVGHIQQQLALECLFQKQLLWPKFNTAYHQTILVLIEAEFADSPALVEFIEQIHRSELDVKIAFYGVQEFDLVEQFIAWPKVVGMFYQDIGQQHFCRGIEAVFAGELWLPRRLMTAYMLHARKPPKSMQSKKVILTRREQEILNLATTGAGNCEIAKALCLSAHTIKTHMYNIFRKLEVDNRIQAVNWAKEYLESMPSLMNQTHEMS